MTRKATHLDEDLASLAHDASKDFENVFDELRRLASVCERLAAASLRKHGKFAPTFLKPVRPDLVRTLSAMDQIVYGVSAVIDAGVIDNVPFELYLIERDADGAIVDDSNVRYPWRASFYEYSNSEWMVAPRTSARPEIVGPFVDIDKYIISLVVPILVEGRFIGVTGADIRLSDYERKLARSLSYFTRDVGVVNSEGRVVLSNCASHPVGSLVHIDRSQSKLCGSTGWSAALLGSD